MKVIPKEEMVMGMNYGCDKLRFLAPVRAGKRVRMHSEVLNVDCKDDNRLLVKIGVSMEKAPNRHREHGANYGRTVKMMCLNELLGNDWL